MVIQAPSRISIARHTVGSSVIEDVINLMKKPLTGCDYHRPTLKKHALSTFHPRKKSVCSALQERCLSG